jgi:hypothetical protein
MVGRSSASLVERVQGVGQMAMMATSTKAICWTPLPQRRFDRSAAINIGGAYGGLARLSGGCTNKRIAWTDVMRCAEQKIAAKGFGIAHIDLIDASATVIRSGAIQRDDLLPPTAA